MIIPHRSDQRDVRKEIKFIYIIYIYVIDLSCI